MQKLLKVIFLMTSLVYLSGCNKITTSSDDSNQTSNKQNVATENVFYGSVNVANKIFDHLNVNGSANLSNVTITQDTLINGSLEGTNITAQGDLQVNGVCTLNDSQVMGESTINGYFEAFGSTLANIHISTQEIQLHNSKVQAIVVRKPAKYDTEQQIVNLDNTTVKSITFEKEGGKVIIRNGAVVQDFITGGMREIQ
jgi:hypothetical protein